MGWLNGRVAIITGASKGIGRTLSQVFAREGASVVCVARSADLVRETAALINDDIGTKDISNDDLSNDDLSIDDLRNDDIRTVRGRATAVVADLASEDGARSAVASALESFGRVDCLVNNAGDGGPTKAVQEYPLEDWRYTIDSCLTSSYLCIRFAVPAMIRAGRGSIVNISSMAGRRGLPYRIGYCSAKAGQIGLTYGLALELGRHNITVNAVLPGAVEGDRIERMMAGQAELRGTTADAIRKSFLERSPLRRMATADDIAYAAVFLCSDHARNISGQCVPVNAGEPAS